jgi:hypothetical protein
MIVFIDRQHAGKPNKVSDRGASRDVDGDGVISADEREAIWTGRLSIELEILLIDMGIKVMPLSDGRYVDRHQRVNAYSNMIEGPWIYLAMHLNAGGGQYGSFFFDHRSSKGAGLAADMATQLEISIDVLREVKAIPAVPDNWTRNAYNTIRGVGRPIAICCEPFFMDTHQSLLSQSGINRVALAMAVAIRNWRDKQ